MRAALVQLRSGDDPAGNLPVTLGLCARAADDGADLILTVLTTLAVAIGQLLHPMLAQFAILAMFIWTVAVIGFILHRALEISLGFGVAAGLFVMTFSFAISQVALSQ
mgnify:CR=1 FL=1